MIIITNIAVTIIIIIVLFFAGENRESLSMLRDMPLGTSNIFRRLLGIWPNLDLFHDFGLAYGQTSSQNVGIGSATSAKYPGFGL